MYYGVACSIVSNTLLIMVEWFIILMFPEHFLTSELQFSFKAKMSTMLCMGTLKNIVANYMHKATADHPCFLYASFNHDIFYKKLA